MELFGRARAQLEAFVARLAPRERAMVGSAAAAVAAFAILMTWAGVASAIGAREQRIDAKTQMLSQIGKLTQGYRQVQAERAALEARLRGPPVQLMSFVSQAGAQAGIEVNDLRPGTPGAGEGVTEESVEVSLARLDLPRLARLLDALERGPGVVKVRRLRMTTRSDDPALVDATLLVATYRLKG